MWAALTVTTNSGRDVAPARRTTPAKALPSPNTVHLRIRSAIPKDQDSPVLAGTESFSARNPAGF
jgi:hypothetical protein